MHKDCSSLAEMEDLGPQLEWKNLFMNNNLFELPKTLLILSAILLSTSENSFEEFVEIADRPETSERLSFRRAVKSGEKVRLGKGESTAFDSVDLDGNEEMAGEYWGEREGEFDKKAFSSFDISF